MAKLSNFKQDLTKAEKGTKIDLGDGLIVTIARVGNKKYQDFLRKEIKPYQQAARNKTLSDDVYEQIMTKAMAEAVLLEWEGLEDENGALIPYSKEKAIEILSDPAFQDFRTLIFDLANEAETFRAQEVAEVVDKSI